jgi:hypothetical protein
MRIGGIFKWQTRARIAPSAQFQRTRKRSYVNLCTQPNFDRNTNESPKIMFNASNFSSRRNPGIKTKEYPKFQYRPLDSAQNEIRLLRISPALHADSTIHCQIFHTSLDNAPLYEALSYAWGDRSGLHKIHIGSTSVHVTPNLDHALRRLRPKPGDPELVIWVDALCINQEDIPERSIQTSKMRTIYQNAEKVSIWLGMYETLFRGDLNCPNSLND